MNDQLRTTLQRVAEAAEPIPVADDLWQRGQAARRRGQALVAAAVLAIIVSVTWSALLLGSDEAREARTASTDTVPGGAISSRIEDIPSDLEVTTDLGVGRGSAAFISSTTSDPVVITATDGVPRRLALPGWVANGLELGDVRVNQSLALSPDGERLAWQAADAEDGRATIGVVELATGSLETFALGIDGARLRLREMSWSPDSRWLAWIADASPSTYVGHLDSGPSAETGYVAISTNVPDVAVGNDGTLLFSRNFRGLFRTDGTDEPERISGATDVGAGRLSPDGRLLALRSGPADASSTLRLSDGAVLTHPFPDGTVDSAVVRPLGWMDGRLQVLFVQEALGGDGADSGELVVTTPEVDDTSTWRRSVGVVEAGPAATLSLAVDLLPDLDGTSSQELTHDFAADSPPAPFGIELSLFIGFGVAAAIAAFLALRWLWRRLR